MKSILTFALKYFVVELLIICTFSFVMNRYVGTVEKSINADAEGYYDYLPSIFIHHDIVRKNDTLTEGLPIYGRVKDLGVYVKYKKYIVNKYPCGTAILQLPFFLCTHAYTNVEGTFADGYQRSFQNAVKFAAAFYLFFAIILLKKILNTYNIHIKWIVFCQLLLVFATSVAHYTTFDAGFSHVYSLFAISLFIYLVRMLFQTKKHLYFIYASAVLGLIVILRQPNVLILLFVPFLADSKNNLWDTIKIVFAKKAILAMSIVIFSAIVCCQLLLWYVQTGDFILYSYQNESFDFLNPQFYNILFSYKKGLFVYTPILLIASVGLLYLLVKKEFYLFSIWILFFVILTYFLSSWWSWFYGCSYGLRAYIDFYPVFFIPFAIMLNGIRRSFSVIIVILSLLTVPVNLIQTYQYNVFILHWIDMDKDMYWKIFLDTHEKYNGLVWKRKYDWTQYKLEKELYIGDIPIVKNSNKIFFKIDSDSIPNFKNVSIIQVSFEDDYKRTDNSKFIFQVSRPDNVYTWTQIPIIHFHENNLDTFQEGVFNFEFEPIKDDSMKTIMLELTTDNQDKILQKLKMKAFSRI